MTKQPDDAAPSGTNADPTTVRNDDALRAEPAPLKQEGDALRDGSGSRQGQSPPNVERPRDS